MIATTSVGTPRARALSAALRDARRGCGLGLRELARLLAISHTDLSLWENGHRVPKLEMVAMIVAALRVVPDERERILDLARDASERNWLAVGELGARGSKQLAAIMQTERAATVITEWSPALIPGLLQRPDHARVILSENGRHADVEPRVVDRMERQDIIIRADPVRLVALLGVDALRNPVLPPAAMADQLAHLARTCARPNIELWIVPSRIGWHPGVGGSFVRYEFPNMPSVLYLEHYFAGAFVPEGEHARELDSAVEALQGLAIGPDPVTPLWHIAAEWRQRS